MDSKGKRGPKEAREAPGRAEVPGFAGLAELQRLFAGGRAARRSELAVKGSNALVATVTFFAAALQEELAAAEAREAALTEQLAAAERALVLPPEGSGLVRPGAANHQRHRAALQRLLDDKSALAVSDEAKAALRFVLGTG